MSNKSLIFISIMIFLLLGGVVRADYFYEPMNFEKGSGRLISFNADYPGSVINVTIPDGFVVVSGANNGFGNVSFVMVFNDSNFSDDKGLFVGSVLVNDSIISDYYLLMIPDEEVVDNKLELGHGDFNYLDNDAIVGREDYLLFSLIRVWGVGSELFDEPLMNVRFVCDYPPVIPSTIDNKYSLISLDNASLTVGANVSRLKVGGLFRVFVLSQRNDFSVNNNYFVNCSSLSYDFSHTRVVASIPEINVSSAGLNPLVVNVSSGDDELLLFLLNNESYDLRDVEVRLLVNNRTFVQNINELLSGDYVKLVLPAFGESVVLTSVSFVPEWYFNSRSPKRYYQSSTGFFKTTDYFSNINFSMIISNASLLTNNLFETQLITAFVNVSTSPLFSDDVKLVFEFFDDQGLLVKSDEKVVRGVGPHEVSMNSDGLEPDGFFADYSVVLKAYFQDEDERWLLIGSSPIGSVRVNQLTSNAPKKEVYDVIVNNVYSRYDLSDNSVKADILLKNVGDVPDRDTVLTYYLLGPDGQKYFETREQFFEVPVGVTLLSRKLPLPSNAQEGVWEFHVDYDTAVQPTIRVHDSFEVVDSIPFFVKLRDRYLSRFFSGKYLFLSLILLMISTFLFIIGVFYVNKRKRVVNR